VKKRFTDEQIIGFLKQPDAAARNSSAIGHYRAITLLVHLVLH
jgi:hypothetical protein